MKRIYSRMSGYRSSSLPLSLAIFVAIFSDCPIAMAQPVTPVTEAPVAPAPDAGAVTVEPPKVRITKKDCNRIIRYVAPPGVAYTPGVDARGNKVAPADLNGGFTIPLPDVYEFAITKDLAGYLDGGEEQLAADKAAAIAAQKSVAATEAAVDSAAQSLEGAETLRDNAAAASAAAAAAAEAAPNDQALADAAATAATEAEAAQTGYAAAESAYNATESAAQSADVSTALTAAQTAEAAAREIGYTPDATAEATSADATRLASEAAAADADALAAAEKVAKSTGMTLNVGTVRFNINTGAMTFNGEPLNDAAMTDLAERCKVMMSQPK